MKTPRVSIIIPAYHSSETISDTLAGLREQTFRDFEVIIVNSSPDEETRRIVEENFPEAIFEQSTRALLPHAARNRGVARARGELLVFTDPDCRPRSDWLQRLVDARGAGHELVCGALELSDEAKWAERGVHLCKYSFRLSGMRAGVTWIAGTGNAACSRDLWNSVGPFDGDHFAGDALFSWRAASHGCQPWFEPAAVVVHHYRGSMRALVSERLYRGNDFAATRMEFEGWSRARAAGHIIAFPIVLLIVLGRGFSEALTTGRARTFVETLPLQIGGHAAWLCGEVRAYYRRALQVTRAKNAVTPLEAE